MYNVFRFSGRKQLLIFFAAGVILTTFSCREPAYTPKPRGYYRIELPKKSYEVFQKETYPYSFEKSKAATVIKDSLFFDKKAENPWWINIEYGQLGGKIFISYKEINQRNTLQKLLEDSYNLSHYHTKKADYIREPDFHTPNNVHGVIYFVGGNAASAFQFFATDSIKHFIRGALYFDVPPNADSLSPVNQYLIEDMEHLIQTLKWTR